MSASLYFEIQADDPARAMQFYQTVFGWQFTFIPNLPVKYWRMESGMLAAGLLTRPGAMPPAECGTNAFVCSVGVADFDQTATAILASGGRVALEKFAVPGRCWQGYFIDTEGNTFGIYQIDPSAE